VQPLLIIHLFEEMTDPCSCFCHRLILEEIDFFDSLYANDKNPD
jgi:hypothetical protein